MNGELAEDLLDRYDVIYRTDRREPVALTKSRSKLKIDPEDVYVAWQGAATDVYVVAAGDRLRGDHPAVQALGAPAFVADGIPQNEWPTVLDGVVATRRRGRRRRPPKARTLAASPRTTTVGELVVCRRPRC